MSEYMDGEIHNWYGHTQPVPDGTQVIAWTVGGFGDWEGNRAPAEQWAWDILDDHTDILKFQVVI